jgi:hypothetical protein
MSLVIQHHPNICRLVGSSLWLFLFQLYSKPLSHQHLGQEFFIIILVVVPSPWKQKFPPVTGKVTILSLFLELSHKYVSFLKSRIWFISFICYVYSLRGWLSPSGRLINIWWINQWIVIMTMVFITVANIYEKLAMNECCLFDGSRNNSPDRDNVTVGICHPSGPR